MGWHKYKAKRIKTRDGHAFASKLEGSLYEQLCLRVNAGEFHSLKCQVQVYLTDAKILMKPDFSALDTTNDETIYFEAKGIETDVWRIKRRLWEYYGPGRLEVYKGTYRNVELYEIIIPKRGT